MTPTFEEALANCASEPIHTPGAIQPFGVLLALADDLRITQCSENVAAALGHNPEAVLGRSVEALTGRDIRCPVSGGEFCSGQRLKLELPGKPAWEATMHRHRGQLIMELECVPPANELGAASAGLGWVETALAIIEAAPSVPALCQHACEQIQRITGLDGAMVYRFHEDGHGEVIAEAKDEHWPRYMGLHYPASDIPPQARAVFLDNWVRMIPERDYVPVRLVGADSTAAPLDLGRSLLRSVSPVHIEYLRNMGVRASLTLSLISEGRLWGLIAGHHYRDSLHVPPQRRAAAEIVARLVSQQLARREELEIAGDRQRGREVLAKVVAKMNASSELVDGLVEQPHDARDILGSGGAAIELPNGDWARIGQTPSPEQLKALATWLDQRESDWRLFHSAELSRDYPPAVDFAACASGLLALRIPKGSVNHLFWFKPEVVRTITWAGDPNKPLAPESGFPRLRPRTSFQDWVETVKLKSLPWARWEIDLIEALSHAVIGIDLQRQFDRAIEARATAEWANDQKEQLLAMVSHDLKNPLHSVIVGLTLIQKTVPAESLAKAHTVLNAMQRSLLSMGHLIDDLLSIAKLEAGSVPLEIQEHSAASLFADAFDLLQPIAIEKGVVLSMAADSLRDCKVLCDRERILQVLSNLIGNAVKFTPSAGRVCCRLSKSAREVCFSVEDTGPGIAPENLSHVFDRFWQARQMRRLGTGLGLAIAQGLIVKHGGRIWAESVLGQGSAFHFTLPLTSDEPSREKSR